MVTRSDASPSVSPPAGLTRASAAGLAARHYSTSRTVRPVPVHPLCNKVREFGDLLSRHPFLADPEDVFFLRPDKARKALNELRMHWS